MPPYVHSLLRMYEFSSNKSFKTDQRITGGSSQSPIGYYTDGSECMGEPGKLRLGHTVFFCVVGFGDRDRGGTFRVKQPSLL